MWEMAHSLLTQLEFDKNLLELPEGVLRVMQLIFDGHGWTSRCGTVRFTLRCVHTIEDHNSTRNARDPIFALGTDKCADIAKVITVGGERSMQVSACTRGSSFGSVRLKICRGGCSRTRTSSTLPEAPSEAVSAM